jgi:hypothetical protein
VLLKKGDTEFNQNNEIPEAPAAKLMIQIHEMLALETISFDEPLKSEQTTHEVHT